MRVQTCFLRRPARLRLVALLMLGTAIGAPVSVDLAPGKAPALTAAFAHARGGDDGGGDDSGGRGRGGDDNGGDDNGGRGRGGDDRGGDDHGGRGRGSDDGRSDDRGEDRGRGRGRDDGRKAEGAPGTIGAPAGGVPARIERSARGIEVTYADGWREELENGRYELKDARNRTVVERPATRQDYGRLGAIAR